MCDKICQLGFMDHSKLCCSLGINFVWSDHLQVNQLRRSITALHGVVEMLHDLKLDMTGGREMFDPAILEKYRQMPAEEKIQTLDQVLDMDVPPLDMVVAFYAVIKPNRADSMAAKLKAVS